MAFRRLTGTVKRVHRAGVLAMTLLAIAPAIAAEDPNNTNVQREQTRSTRRESVDLSFGREFVETTNVASEYSKKNQAVGIVIAYLASPEMPSIESVGDNLVKRFKLRGIEARYFVVTSPRVGAAATYVIEDVVIGPFGDKATAEANVDRAVTLRKGADKVKNYR